MEFKMMALRPLKSKMVMNFVTFSNRTRDLHIMYGSMNTFYNHLEKNAIRDKMPNNKVPKGTCPESLRDFCQKLSDNSN